MPEALIAYSCDKNFGLYRDRVGAFYALARDAGDIGRILSNGHALARAAWSMPPDHGAAAVRLILSDPGLTASWLDELEQMRMRIRQVRARLADAGRIGGVDLAPLGQQNGMFATLPLGKAQVTHPGTQVTVIAYGLMAHYALEAADRVADEGISVEVVDLRTLRPLDKETVLDSVRKTGKCLVVYEDNRFGGYGAEVAAIVAEEAFDYLDGPVTRIAGPDVPGVPYNHALEDWFMVNPEKIADSIRKLAAY